MSDTYKIVYRAVIKQCIDDLLHQDEVIRKDAIKYLHGDMFESHRKIAKYPEGLRDTLAETLLLSHSEQNYIIDLVNQELADA